MGRENIFKPTIGNGILHQDTNDNDVRIENSATSNNPFVKSMMSHAETFIRKTWPSPDGKTHNHIDHTFIDTRYHSSILHVRYFRGSDYDTEHNLVVAKVREK